MERAGKKYSTLTNRRHNQLAQMIPTELTGMNTLGLMHCSSTAEPCEPEMPPLVPGVVEICKVA